MLLMCFLIVFSVSFYNFYWKRRKLPPGPFPLPIFGNVLTIASHYPGYAAFQLWADRFGPIFTYWIGEIPIVAVTSFDLIKETFVKDGEAYAGRDFLNAGFELLTSFSGGVNGVVRTKGKHWREMRRFTTQTLRNLGMGKSGRTGIEAKIITEVDSLLEILMQEIKNGVQEHNLMELVDVAVGSIITQVMFGYRFHETTSRSKFIDLKRTMAQETEMSSQTLCKMVLMMPWLRHFPFFSTAFEKFDQNISKQFEFFDQQISQKIMERSANNPDTDKFPPNNFVDAFLNKLDSFDSTEQEKYFTICSLRCLCFELFGAGQETTSNTLNFLVLYLMLNQKLQLRLQEELDRVIGSDRTILTSDKSSLPYTNAVINECQRLCNLFPQNLPHQTTRDVVICGHQIAKGTVIVPQICCVLYDEKIFPKPHEFIPERFLDINGQLKKCEELIPFSVGKRQCLGESLARMELFLFTANIFNHFKITVADPTKPPSTEKINGMTVRPMDYVCHVEERRKAIAEPCGV